MSDEESSSDDDQEDEDYDDKYVNRKLKQETGGKRQGSSKEDDDDHKTSLQSLSHLFPAIQIPLDSSKSPEELDFLIRLNTYVAERSSYDTKHLHALRDGEFPVEDLSHKDTKAFLLYF